MTRSSHGWQLFGRSLYYTAKGKKSWYDAEYFCRSRGAHLASILSDEEQVLYFSFFSPEIWVTPGRALLYWAANLPIHFCSFNSTMKYALLQSSLSTSHKLCCISAVRVTWRTVRFHSSSYEDFQWVVQNWHRHFPEIATGHSTRESRVHFGVYTN